MRSRGFSYIFLLRSSYSSHYFEHHNLLIELKKSGEKRKSGPGLQNPRDRGTAGPRKKIDPRRKLSKLKKKKKKKTSQKEMKMLT